MASLGLVRHCFLKKSKKTKQKTVVDSVMSPWSWVSSPEPLGVGSTQYLHTGEIKLREKNVQKILKGKTLIKHCQERTLSNSFLLERTEQGRQCGQGPRVRVTENAGTGRTGQRGGWEAWPVWTRTQGPSNRECRGGEAWQRHQAELRHAPAPVPS